MGILAIVIVFAIIAWIDLLPLIRKRSWKGIAALLFFFIPALVLAVLWNYKIQVPSTLLTLGEALKSMGISYKP
ncbi:hypothetical protein [Scatolibacter rhodanostii]|uniref:hypothetical protein n=1 Tax=Scatolibacter rhodanostii TaxID=2014781 RepID=UPI000C08CE38|nr:hypothetical protein [Scatolibacter rhodanostii]